MRKSIVNVKVYVYPTLLHSRDASRSFTTLTVYYSLIILEHALISRMTARYEFLSSHSLLYLISSRTKGCGLIHSAKGLFYNHDHDQCLVSVRVLSNVDLRFRRVCNCRAFKLEIGRGRLSSMDKA